jgi:hypothetical protein
MNVYLAFLSVAIYDHGAYHTQQKVIDRQANHASTKRRRRSTSIASS